MGNDFQQRFADDSHGCAASREFEYLTPSHGYAAQIDRENAIIRRGASAAVGIVPSLNSPVSAGVSTGCGAVWLAHLVWDQGVEGSNPFSPTIETVAIATVSFGFGATCAAVVSAGQTKRSVTTALPQVWSTLLRSTRTVESKVNVSPSRPRNCDSAQSRSPRVDAVIELSTRIVSGILSCSIMANKATPAATSATVATATPAKALPSNDIAMQRHRDDTNAVVD